jgi:hypothetical protein
MRVFSTWACMVLLLAGTAIAQQPATPGKSAESKTAGSAAPRKGLDALLEAKIRASWAAFKNRDKKAYGEFLADDYQAVEADGDGARSKQHMLRESEASMMTEYALSFFKVTPLGPDAAFVRYEAFFRFPAKSAVKFEKVYIGEVWVKRGGQWKSLHYQETRVK